MLDKLVKWISCSYEENLRFIYILSGGYQIGTIGTRGKSLTITS